MSTYIKLIDGVLTENDWANAPAGVRSITIEGRPFKAAHVQVAMLPLGDVLVIDAYDETERGAIEKVLRKVQGMAESVSINVADGLQAIRERILNEQAEEIKRALLVDLEGKPLTKEKVFS